MTSGKHTKKYSTVASRCLRGGMYSTIATAPNFGLPHGAINQRDEALRTVFSESNLLKTSKPASIISGVSSLSGATACGTGPLPPEDGASCDSGSAIKAKLIEIPLARLVQPRA